MNHVNHSSNAVKAIIFNYEHKMLLLQRNAKHADDTDNWDLPGGLVDEGEDEKDALAREIREELDVNSHILSKSGKWNFIRPSDKKKISVQNYVCKIDGNIKLSRTHKKYAWIRKEDITKYPVKDQSIYSALNKVQG